MQESEGKLFRMMFENHQAMMLLIEPETGKILDANKAAEKFYGYSQNEFRSLKIQNLNQLPKQEVELEMSKALKKEKNSFVFSHRLANGEIRSVEVYSSPIFFRKTLMLFSIIHDVTERKKAEDEIKQSHLFLERIAEASPDIVFVHDINKQKNIFTSKSIQNVLGYEPEEFCLIPDLFEKIVVREDLEKTKNFYQETTSPDFKDKTVFLLTHRVRHKNGTTRWLEIRVTPFSRNDNGTLKEVIGTARDITDQKNATKSLEESEAKLSSIFHASPIGIGLVSYPDRTILDVNEQVLIMTGYSRKELIGHSVRIFYPEEQDYQIVGTQKYRLIKEKGKGTVETRWKRKNGEIFNVLLSSSPLNSQNLQLGTTFTVLDITKKKHSEEALKKSEKNLRQARDLLRAVTESSTDLVVAIDTEFNFIFFNKAFKQEFEKLFRVNIGVGNSLPESLSGSPEDRENVLKHWKTALKGEDIRVSMEFRDSSQNRKIFDSRFYPINDDEGHLIGAGQISRDITEQTQTYEKIKHWASFPELNPNPILEVSYMGKIILVNPAAIEFLNQLGLTDDPKKLLPKDLPDLLKESDNWKTPMRFEREVEIGKLYFLLTLVAIPQSKTIRVYGKNITDLKEAAKVLKRDKVMLEKLVQKRTEELWHAQKEMEHARRLSDIGTLSATVAHELRNPLAAIHLAAFNIRKKTTQRKIPGLEVEKHLANIDKKVREGDQIINNLLFYSRLRIPHREKVKIYELLTECGENAKKHQRNKNAFFKKNIETVKDMVLYADPVQLKELFVNLLNNAFDALENKAGIVALSAEAGQDVVKIQVKDTGKGIPTEDLKKVWEPFYSTKSRGTGLGLSVSRQILELHNGKFEIKSEPGKGTIVSIELPKNE